MGAACPALVSQSCSVDSGVVGGCVLGGVGVTAAVQGVAGGIGVVGTASKVSVVTAGHYSSSMMNEP